MKAYIYLILKIKKISKNLNKRKIIETQHNLFVEELKNEQKQKQKQKQEDIKIKYEKIGRPAFRIGKEKEFISHKMKIKFELEYSLIKTDITPQFRIMSELEINNMQYPGIIPSF